MERPKFIISKKKVLEQYTKLKEICDFVSYSSKTNQVITKILEDNTDSLFSVHFVNELKHVKDTSRVLFIAQAWNQPQISDLIARGINSFIVDNEADLNKLIIFLENNDFHINLFLRIKFKENTVKTERYFVFGMRSDVVNEKIRELRKNREIAGKLISLGIHFHRKSQNVSEWNLKEEFENIIEKDVLKLIDVVNVGGGLPSQYANTNVNVIEGVLAKIKGFRNWLKQSGVKMVVEPGRFLAASSVKLVAEIIGMYENNIIVNASVYNGDMDALIIPIKLLVEGELRKEGKFAKPYVIKGMTPCSMDLFRYRVYLKEPKLKDKIIFLNAGAYNFSTDFCDLDKIDYEIVEDF